MNFTNMIVGTIFSSIGFVAFVYGKKEALWKPLVIGVVLMAYPFLISNTTLVVVIGSVLTAALFLFRD